MPPALAPAIALLAGAVAGGSIDVSLRAALPLLPILVAAAAVAWWRAASRTACVLAAAGFGLGSALLASDARDAALSDFDYQHAAIRKHDGALGKGEVRSNFSQ